MRLTVKEKAVALNRLAKLEISLVVDDVWMADLRDTDITNGGTFVSCQGYGETPEEAIESLWSNLTETIRETQYICVGSSLSLEEGRKYFRWTDFMWSQIPERLVQNV